MRAPETPLDELPLDLPLPEAIAAPKQVAFATPVWDRPTRVPLSYHQERLWFIDRFEKGTVYESNPTYHNMPFLMHCRGQLDCGALEWCLSQLLERHTACAPALWQTVKSRSRWFCATQTRAGCVARAVES